MLIGFPWWLIVIIGSLILTIRNSFGKNVAPLASAYTITFCRFFFSALFGVPFFIYLSITNIIKPHLTNDVWFYLIMNTALQVPASILIFNAFRKGRFGIITVFSKTVILFALINGMLFFGEYPSVQALIGMVIAMTGLFWLHIKEENKNIQEFFFMQKIPTEIISIIFGSFLLSFANFFAKLASMRTDVMTTSVCMFLLNILCILLLAYPSIKKDTPHIVTHWKEFLLFGFFAFLTTVIYIYAFSIAPIAYVEMVTQIEVVFGGLIAYWYFKEKSIRKRIPQILVTVTGIVLIVMAQ